MSQDELQKALRVARSVHDRETGPADSTAVILGALLRAVEILAERQDKPTEADSGIVEAVQAALNMAKQDLEAVLRREAELHVMLRNFALPTEPKALARELTGRQKSTEEDHARIAELEKRIAEQDAEHEKIIEDKRRAEARVRAWEARTGETGPSAPRIVGAKLEPVTADGKTPGQVALEAWNPGAKGYTIYPGDWERAAQAVLRAFGQPSQTTQDAAIEALERVADTANNGARRLVDDGVEHDRVLHKIWHDAVSGEISRLRAEPSQPAQTSAVDVLRRVREKLKPEAFPNDYDKGAMVISRDLVLNVIDAELARLEAMPAQSPPDTSTESGVPDAVLREMP